METDLVLPKKGQYAFADKKEQIEQAKKKLTNMISEDYKSK